MPMPNLAQKGSKLRKFGYVRATRSAFPLVRPLGSGRVSMVNSRPVSNANLARLHSPNSND
jgi:hypothetical protein